MSSPPPERQCESRYSTPERTYRCQREAGHPEYHGSVVAGIMWPPDQGADPRRQGPTPNREMRDA